MFYSKLKGILPARGEQKVSTLNLLGCAITGSLLNRWAPHRHQRSRLGFRNINPDVRGDMTSPRHLPNNSPRILLGIDARVDYMQGAKIMIEN